VRFQRRRNRPTVALEGFDMSHHETAARGPDARLVDRMVFFSDAVFAIVLTLLVLELRPPLTPWLDDVALAKGLVEETLRHFISFAISFALVSIFWAAHLRMTRRLIQFDWWVAMINLVFLFTIGLMPFVSSLLGEHMASPLAMQVYAGALVIASVTQSILWLAITRGGGRLMGGVEGRELFVGLLRAISPGIVFGVVLGLIHYGHIEQAHWAPMAIVPILLGTRFIAGRRPRAPA
jgi:uncharacterized membrane protein